LVQCGDSATDDVLVIQGGPTSSFYLSDFLAEAMQQFGVVGHERKRSCWLLTVRQAGECFRIAH
jgi:hypothetical protein